METVLNVVIADGNEAFAESLKSTLEQNGGFSVVGISGDGEVILDTMLRTRADILILDPMLTGMDGLGVLSQLRNSQLKPMVMVISTFASEYLQGSDGRAWGKLLHEKPCAMEAVVRNLEDAAQYRCQAAGRVTTVQRQNAHRNHGHQRHPRDRCSGPHQGLSVPSSGHYYCSGGYGCD